MHENDSEFLHHEPCPACGSSDNLARYTDGHAYCFGCGHYEPPTDQEASIKMTTKTKDDFTPVAGAASAWESRGITLQSAEKWGFTRGNTSSGDPVRVFNYRDENQRLIAQKLRFKGKEFRFIGDTKNAGLFGQHLWRDGGRRIVIVEGELDAISLSQVQGHKWPVVSVPNGAQGAAKSLEKSIKWLDQFDEIVLMFDMAEPGRAAVEACTRLFAPGKVKIASLPLKDPNEMLMAGRTKELVDAIFEAKTYRPDGILAIDDLLEEIVKPVEQGLPWFLEELTHATFGRRYGEIYGFGAGTGVGKTDFLTQQISYDVFDLEEKVGCIFLEQKPTETAKRIAGKSVGRMFHLPDGQYDPAELLAAAERLQGKVWFYDNFGETEWSVVKSQIRFMHHGFGIRIFYVDHLTAMATPGNEKDSLEQIMKEMAMLANELSIIIHFVSHLTTPEGKPHEEGGRVMIRHFKGSRAIGFWSFFMFGLERNQQSADEGERSTTVFRVLKDRYTGRSTGMTIYLGYDRETGRLFARDDVDEFETEAQNSEDSLPDEF